MKKNSLKKRKNSPLPNYGYKYLLIEPIEVKIINCKDGKTKLFYKYKEQDSFIRIAEDKGYKVLLLDSL